jgi:hypothetical protein
LRGGISPTFSGSANYVRRIPRSIPELPGREDTEKQRESFAERLVTLLESPAHDMFFGDEAGFEGDHRPRSKWVKRGSRPTQGYYGGHVRQNVVGTVNPATGQLVSLIVPHCDNEVFQMWLDVMAREVTEKKGSKTVLVLDRPFAKWNFRKAEPA